MSSRMMAAVILAGTVLISGAMMGGCKKEPTPASKAASDKVAAAAADAKEAVKKAADETAKVAGEAAKAAKDVAETAVDSAKTAVDNTKTAVVEAVASVEQTICPVMASQPIDKSIFVEYKGKKVYFCCASCKGVFEKDPEKYIAKLPQFKK